MLQVKELHTHYGELHVIKNISLQVNKGEFTAIFGPNGHGKSTLLKTICGLIKPTSGQIIFNDILINKIETPKIVEMGLVYVAEVRHLFPEMTVLENLKMGAYNRRARKEEKQNLEFVFQMFPRLHERQRQLAATLSGGEAQMLALARGIMSSARLLAIDEPSLGLAPNLVTQIFEKIKEINKAGINILLVEQNIAQVAELADFVYILEEGRIVFSGGQKDVFNDSYAREILLGC